MACRGVPCGRPPPFVCTYGAKLGRDSRLRENGIDNKAEAGKPRLVFTLFNLLTPMSSAHHLSPVTFSAQGTRLVSYYAFFKWWLLLSQHPSCMCPPLRFPLSDGLGALDDGLGCFPLATGR